MTADTPQDIVERLRASLEAGELLEDLVETAYRDMKAIAAWNLRASSKQAGPGGWNTALEEAAKAVECICVQAMNEDFVRGAREFRKGAANVIRALKASPAAAQPEPTDDTAAKQRHEVRVKAEGFDQVLTGPVELMKPPEPKASSLVEALKMMRTFGCPRCHGDCAAANPPVLWCPMQICEAALKSTPHPAPDVVEVLREAQGYLLADEAEERDDPGDIRMRLLMKIDAALASAGTPGEKR